MNQVHKKFQTNPMTPHGYEKLLAEQKKLVLERPHAVSELKRAREMGDLSENGFYKGARGKLSEIDRKLRTLTRLIRSAKIEEHVFTGNIVIGSQVIVHDGKENLTLQIVGSYEANPAEGKISHISPLGKLLMGKKKGEQITLLTPSGSTNYSIVEVYSNS